MAGIYEDDRHCGERIERDPSLGFAPSAGGLDQMQPYSSQQSQGGSKLGRPVGFGARNVIITEWRM